MKLKKQVNPLRGKPNKPQSTASTRRSNPLREKPMRAMRTSSKKGSVLL